jgi:Domain of unknown function (DUF4160)
MPTLAIIDGISILMWPNDHNPPHFHVRFARRRGKFDIATGRMIEGTLDRKAIKKVQAWTMSNQAMLSQPWSNLRQQTMTTKS